MPERLRLLLLWTLHERDCREDEAQQESRQSSGQDCDPDRMATLRPSLILSGGAGQAG